MWLLSLSWVWAVWVVLLVWGLWVVRRGWKRGATGTVQAGRVAVVAGAGVGRGYHTALELARRGARVVVAGPDREVGQQTVTTIARLTNNTQVRYMHLDLSSLASVRRFSDELKATEAKVDVLVNNASVWNRRRERTADGFLRDVQINYLGPFLLTVRSVPLLRAAAPSGVVMVSSSLHRFGTIEGLDDERVGRFKAYASTKLCGVLFARELSRRLAGGGVAVNCADSGLVRVPLDKNASVIERALNALLYPFAKTPAEAALTSVHVAVSDAAGDVTGGYFKDFDETEPSAQARDEALAKRLWATTVKLLKIDPDELNELLSIN